MAETAETNNMGVRSVVIGSDLSVSAITAPTKGAAGSSIVVTDTTTNQGGGDAPASTVAFYLSTTSVGGPSDVLLDGSRGVPALAPGTSSTGPTTVTIPAGTAAGTFYIIAKADAANVVTETNEANNTRSKSISIGPDLTFSSLSLSPITVAAGGTLTVSDTVTNQGAGIAAPLERHASICRQLGARCERSCARSRPCRRAAVQRRVQPRLDVGGDSR